MDGYIRGLKHEAEQMLSDVDEAKERGRRELDDTDHQIFELMRQKDEQKAKVDKKVKTLKNQADAKMAMYHRAAGTTPSHRRIGQVSAMTPVVVPVKEPLFTEAIENEAEAEAEEDATYYPSKAAKKRDLVNSPEYDHEHDTSRKMIRRDLKSESAASGPIHSSGYPVDIEDYPIIVQHPKDKNTWIQIFCPICKGNMRGDGKWFKGVMGAKRHIRLAHKAISTMTTNKVLFGAHEVDRLVERRFTPSELDDLRNGRIPAPVARQGTSETLDDSFDQKDDVMVAYVLFPQYPVIIRRADGEWVELRCPDCDGNSVNGKYFDGVDAFRKHLEREHGHTVPLDEEPAEWVVQQCETRKLTEDECMALLEDREDAEPPEKINIRVAAANNYDDKEGDLPREESYEDDAVIKPRSQKRHARSARDMFEEDSDDLNEHTPKRTKRDLMLNGGQNQTTTPSYLRTAISPVSIRTTRDFRMGQYDTPTREDGLFSSRERRPSGAQEHRPPMAQEHRPTVAQEHRPTVAEERRPSMAQEHRPSTAQDHRPSMAQEHRPSTAQEHRPFTSQERRPSTAQEHRPSTAQEHRSSTAQQGLPYIAHEKQQAKNIPTNTIPPRSIAVKTWSDCCPCTLEGHECQNSRCSKAKVCMQLDHSKYCRPGATHMFTPLCMMFTLGSACDAGTCAFSHDEELKMALESHDCDEH